MDLLVFKGSVCYNFSVFCNRIIEKGWNDVKIRK